MSRRRQINDRPTWVYRLTGEDNDLLYVGVAVDFERRLGQHRATKAWWDSVVFADAEQYPTRKQALEVELHYIETERPFFNIVGLPPEIERPHEPTGRRGYIWRRDNQRLEFEFQNGQVS